MFKRKQPTIKQKLEADLVFYQNMRLKLHDEIVNKQFDLAAAQAQIKRIQGELATPEEPTLHMVVRPIVFTEQTQLQ